MIFVGLLLSNTEQHSVLWSIFQLSEWVRKLLHQLLGCLSINMYAVTESQLKASEKEGHIMHFCLQSPIKILNLIYWIVGWYSEKEGLTFTNPNILYFQLSQFLPLLYLEALKLHTGTSIMEKKYGSSLMFPLTLYFLT